MFNILKEKQSHLSPENSENVSLLLALLQTVWKCKPVHLEESICQPFPQEQKPKNLHSILGHAEFY